MERTKYSHILVATLSILAALLLAACGGAKDQIVKSDRTDEEKEEKR